jgi:hypothetical protein
MSDPILTISLRWTCGLSTTCTAMSLRITSSVADWEDWTGGPLPVSGSYVFPDGLVPLEVDRDADQGQYWEPNVWFIHHG